MNYLVTGANGYVGRNLVKFLVKNFECINLIAMTRNESDLAYFENLNVVHQLACYDDLEKMISILDDVDVVFHVAADLKNWSIDKDNLDFNISSTEMLLKAVEKTKVSKFIYVSTEAVLLSKSSLKNINSLTPYPIKNLGVYSQSKKIAEKLVLEQSKLGCDFISIRPRMVWGRDNTTIYPKLIKALKSGMFIWINKGEYLTSTTHIDNLCIGLYNASIYGESGRAYFITDGEPIYFKRFIEILTKHDGIKLPKLSINFYVALIIAYVVEFAWKLFKKKSTPPIMISQLYLTGREVTINDTQSFKDLNYKPIKFF